AEKSEHQAPNPANAKNSNRLMLLDACPVDRVEPNRARLRHRGGLRRALVWDGNTHGRRVGGFFSKASIRVDSKEVVTLTDTCPPRSTLRTNAARPSRTGHDAASDFQVYAPAFLDHNANDLMTEHDRT